MSRVEWSRLSPEEFETVCGILLLRRFDRATRVKPGRGDQGIDVLIPHADNSIGVVQVKSFSGPKLTPSHKKQIAASLARVNQKHRQTIADWQLLLPMDPTPGRLTWLAELSSELTFPTTWRGTDYLDSLAAEFPDVIDYYVHGGRERVERQYADVMSFAALALQVSQQDPTLPPGQAIDTLHASIRAMNASDPHYRFDVRLTEGAPGPTQTNGHVLSASSDSGRGTVVTIDVIARYPQATEDRPLRFNLQIDHDERVDEFVDWIEYGGRYDGTGTIDFVDGLPGGLPGAAGPVHFRLGTRSTDSPLELELAVFDPSGARLATVPLVLTDRSAGTIGARFEGRDPSGFFIVSGTAHKEGGRINVTLTRDPEAIIGRPVRLCIDAIRAADHMHTPNSWGLGWRHAGLLGPRAALPAQMQPAATRGMRELLEALVLLQDYCDDALRVPDDMSDEEAEDIAVAAQLLRGETVEASFSKLEFELRPGAGELPAESAIVTESEYECVVLGQRVALGTVRCMVESARVLSDQLEPDGARHVILVPGSTARLRYQKLTS